MGTHVGAESPRAWSPASARYFSYPGREVLVAFVDGRHPWLDARRMRMTFLHQAVRKLQQQLHLLAGLLQQQQQSK